MSIIRLQNIPPGSQVGLDLHSWQSGPNFRGIRDVPEGLHCLHVTIANVSLTKYAVWLSTCPGQSASYAWQAIEQSLIRQDSPNDLHLGEEMFFVSCPSEPDKQYTAISRHLNADTVRRFVPLGTVVTSTSTSNTETLAEELKKLDASLSASAADRILQFTTVDLKRSWRPGAVGRELTEQSLDKSWLLRSTIQCCGSQAGFLAEFEFCFLSVLLYGSLAACDQYNILLLLVANAKSALLTEQAFFEDFLALLHAQMQQVPEELFSDVFSLNVPQQVAVLQKHVKDFSGEGQVQSLQAVSENIDILLDLLNREFNVEHVLEQSIYPFDDANGAVGYESSEPDDEKPVIVEDA